MKPIGLGLIILLVAFILGAYALFVPWTIIQRAQAGGYTGLDAFTDFVDSLYNALQIGLAALILGIIGTLVFFVEFRKHEHTTHLAPSPPPSPSENP
jgi:uncharacterized membrane protein